MAASFLMRPAGQLYDGKVSVYGVKCTVTDTGDTQEYPGTAGLGSDSRFRRYVGGLSIAMKAVDPLLAAHFRIQVLTPAGDSALLLYSRYFAVGETTDDPQYLQGEENRTSSVEFGIQTPEFTLPPMCCLKITCVTGVAASARFYFDGLVYESADPDLLKIL